jgi:hypothetical protein
MSNTEDDSVPLEKRGNYHVILGTNVAVHLTEDNILGIMIQEEGEWILVVPVEPTRAMRDASEQYYYDLPAIGEDWVKKKTGLRHELESVKDDIETVYRRLEALMDICQHLEEIQENL